MPPLRKVTPSSSSVCSPGFGCPGSGGGPGSAAAAAAIARAPAGSVGLEPAVQREHLLGRRRRGPLDHLPHRRVLGGDLLALGVARAPARAAAAPPRSRCCRTGCRGSRARSRDGRGGRSAPPSIASSPGVASTGQVLTFSQPRPRRRRSRRAPAARRSARRWPRARRGSRAGWRRSAAGRSHRRGLGARAAVVLCTQTRTRRAGPRRRARRARRRAAAPAVSGGSASNSNSAPIAAAVGELGERAGRARPAARPPGGARRRPAGSGPSRPARRRRAGREHALDPQVVEGASALRSA